MTRAIILHVTVTDVSPLALQALAERCADACDAAGIEVERASIWNPPLTAAPAAASFAPPPPTV